MALQRELQAERKARVLAEGKVRRLEQLEKHKQLLIRAGQVLSRSLDLEQILEALSTLTVPVFADWYLVHLLDHEGGIGLAHAAHRSPEKIELARRSAERWPASRGSSIGVAAVIDSGESILIESISPQLIEQVGRDQEHRELLFELGLRSAMIVPLGAGGKVFGAMTFITAESEHRYGVRELAVAEAVANRAALAIENAWLYRDAREARDEAEDAARRLEIMARASDAILRFLDPDDALRSLAAFMVEELADYCVTYRCDQNGAIRRVGVAHADPKSRHLVEALATTAPPTIGDGQGVGGVICSGQPIFAAEVSEDLLERAALSDEHLELLRKLKPFSSLVVPLVARGRTLGAMSLTTTTCCSRRTYVDADLATAMEIARRVAMLLDNARLYAEARRATRARDDMLAVVSHDLRNPLTAVVNGCELLTLELDDERRLRVHDSIRRAASQMKRLLDNLLDVTRIEEGRLTLKRELVDGRALIAEVVEIQGPTAEAAKVGLMISGDDQVRLQADRNAVVQLLTNLVSNAVKYTPAGGTVTLSVVRDGDQARFRIEDTGVGIGEEELPRLFQRFWRASATAQDGKGLGLAIAKGIAEAHGGRIEVDSAIGRGSIFEVILPRKVSDRPSSRPPAQGEATILVVDDDQVLREHIIELFVGSGFAVLAAANGKDALETLQSEPPPDVIVLDLMMPVMDGWELMARLQGDPRLAAIPVVCVTAADGELEGSAPETAHAVVHKPFSADELVATVRNAPRS